MTDAAFVVGAYGAAAIGLGGYAVSLIRRARQARARRAAVLQARDRVVGRVVPTDARSAEEGPLPAVEP